MYLEGGVHYPCIWETLFVTLEPKHRLPLGTAADSWELVCKLVASWVGILLLLEGILEARVAPRSPGTTDKQILKCSFMA